MSICMFLAQARLTPPYRIRKREGSMKRSIDIKEVQYSAIMITFCFKNHGMDFGAISERMGIEPSYTRREADFPEAAKKAGWATDIWELTSGFNESRQLAEEFKKFIGMYGLWERVGAINELKRASGMKTSLSVVVQAWLLPYLLISRECIEFAHRIDTEIDLAVYQYEAEGGEIPYCHEPKETPKTDGDT